MLNIGNQSVGKYNHLSSCPFCDTGDHSVYEQYHGIVLSTDEGDRAARLLENKKAGLMKHHGPLTVGQTAEETDFCYASLEKRYYN
ncbi:uncharacterized protein Z520_01666 [Fonsecaea multimorphosa CBS 102226]|uniref:Class II aldolase/adducin N-terminal domain-containing protein n=1 Tax=Fonsecaea multimorphosa CBS 102226 TaxID=1442371 RepID=A0A0D2L2B5_9EURO|nr:uncharacterized protein Z520_01666 [Fonsecaea multimorphosa CBS 102226]KIY03199.1 hypothetical protein Z520_01666 [Fonsecaea multimorphosa CBS 102226]